MFFQMSGQICRSHVQSRRCFSGQKEQLPGPGFPGCFCARGFLQDNMRVGSADAEGTDPGPERKPVCLPFAQLGVDVERAVIKRNLRIRLFEIKAWRNHPVFHGKDGFDQSGRARGRVQMAYVCLYGPDGAEVLFLQRTLPRLKRLGQGLNFNGISQYCSGSVRFDISDGFRINAGHDLGFGDDFGLSLHAGCCVAHFR